MSLLLLISTAFISEVRAQAFPPLKGNGCDTTGVLTREDLTKFYAKRSTSGLPKAPMTLEQYLKKAEEYIAAARCLFPSSPALLEDALKHKDMPQESVVEVPFEYFAYAGCFYGGLIGGGDPVDVGDECKAEWID